LSWALAAAERQDVDEDFRLFKRQIFHTSLAKILSPLKPAMTTPEVTRCWDGHFRKAIYGIGPYIADYQEQVLVASVVQGWCAKCLVLPDDMERCGITRTYEHTKTVIEAFGLQVAWNEYGISGDIKVCLRLSTLISGTRRLTGTLFDQPFTDGFPRADIHELLAPDILHQLIKGVFKDHLVQWVEDYLVLTHGRKRADEILSDIDRR